jgi:sugar/nucleoside kinase (ribokinase family)
MIVCLGEGLIDLICEAPVGSLTEADSFTPHFGGCLANVAVAAARGGDRRPWPARRATTSGAGGWPRG